MHGAQGRHDLEEIAMTSLHDKSIRYKYAAT